MPRCCCCLRPGERRCVTGYVQLQLHCGRRGQSNRLAPRRPAHNRPSGGRVQRGPGMESTAFTAGPAFEACASTIRYVYRAVQLRVLSAWFLERFSGVLGQCVFRKSARRVLETCFYARDTVYGRWWTRWRHKKRFLERGYVLNFDRSIDSLFGLKITVALRTINKIVFILSADHLNKF